eukprot:1146092-Pelagomonas_calceolata.AAC.4
MVCQDAFSSHTHSCSRAKNVTQQSSSSRLQAQMLTSAHPQAKRPHFSRRWDNPPQNTKACALLEASQQQYIECADNFKVPRPLSTPCDNSPGCG